MKDMMYIRRKMQREGGHKENLRTSKESTVKEEESTHNRYRALSILDIIREEDEAEEPMYVFDKSDNGRWIRQEAAVDSGAVECVTSKKRMLHLIEETPESRGETRTCAGGNVIKKEGKETVNWRTDWGTMKRGVFLVGPVWRTLISVDRLQETGHDVILTKNKPRIVNLRTGEVMPLRKDGGMFILTHVDFARVLHGRGKSSQKRPRKSMFRSGRQTGCWRRVQRHHEPR